MFMFLYFRDFIYILGNLLLWYYIVLKCKGRFLLHTSFVANETSILLVCMRFEILSSQGLLTKKQLYTIYHELSISCWYCFNPFMILVVFYIMKIVLQNFMILCTWLWFFYCRRWNISIKCIIYFDLWLFFCSNNYLCYIYKE